MISELVSRVLAARDIAHREHWATKSFAAHRALNDFYSDVLEAIDAVVENYQGMFDNIGPFEVKTEPVKDIGKYLSDEMDWIESNRDMLANNSASVGALIDSLVSVYTKAVYMLRMK